MSNQKRYRVFYRSKIGSGERTYYADSEASAILQHTGSHPDEQIIRVKEG